MQTNATKNTFMKSTAVTQSDAVPSSFSYVISAFKEPLHTPTCPSHVDAEMIGYINHSYKRCYICTTRILLYVGGVLFIYSLLTRPAISHIPADVESRAVTPISSPPSPSLTADMQFQTSSSASHAAQAADRRGRILDVNE